jgi:hypothetical protein
VDEALAVRPDCYEVAPQASDQGRWPGVANEGCVMNLYESTSQLATAAQGSTPGVPMPPQPRTVLTKTIESTDEERAGSLLGVFEP